MPKPKKFIFVLMPFSENFNDIYTYGIKQTCSELDTYCERVDEQIFSERILDRIYNQIAKADIIVADMTGRNANVFYEVGYAHGLGKNVILLTQKTDDIPFDLKHFPHIIYNGAIKTLSEQLKPRLEWFLNEETKEEVSQFDFGLQFLINGTVIESGKEIIAPKDYKFDYRDYYNMKIDIFNASLKTHKSKFKIGLETSIDFKDLVKGLEVVKPTSEKVIFMSKEIVNVYPGAYKSVDFILNQLKTKEAENIKMPIKLKVFTNFELKEIDFSLIVPTYYDGWRFEDEFS